jgi:hypothetical protein
MATTYKKTKPLLLFNEFQKKVNEVKLFTSSEGKRYKVLKIVGDEIEFTRLDAKSTEPWKMSLSGVFKAYQELNDFKTENFKPFVERKHSPARGLLLHLGMLE